MTLLSRFSQSRFSSRRRGGWNGGDERKINDRLDRSPFKSAPNAADVWQRRLEKLPDNLQSVFTPLDVEQTVSLCEAAAIEIRP